MTWSMVSRAEAVLLLHLTTLSPLALTGSSISSIPLNHIIETSNCCAFATRNKLNRSCRLLPNPIALSRCVAPTLLEHPACYD